MTTLRVPLRAGLFLWALLALATFASGARAQGLYKWIDAEGNIHLTDKPPSEQQGPVKPVPPVEATVEPKAAQANPPAQAKATAQQKSTAQHQASAPVEAPLKRLELPYVGQEGRARRVIVQVKFNERVTAPLALDTGAPGMILSVKLAERLELFSRDQGKLVVLAKGIGGSAPAIRTILESVDIGGAVERFVPVTVTPQLSEAFDGLVGMDFMSQYSMTIDPKKQVVVLLEQPALAEAPGGHAEAWWRDLFAEFRSLRDAWRQYHERIEQEISEVHIDAESSNHELIQLRALAKFQAQEAETLLARVERYASTQAVPRQWR